METVTYLLLIYAAIFFLNFLVLFLLWKSSGVRYFRDLSLAWIAVLATLVANGLAASSSYAPRAFAFSVCFFFYSGIAAVLAEMLGMKFPLRVFAGALLVSLAGAVATELLGLPVLPSLMTVTAACGAPSLYVGGLAIARYWKSMSITQRGTAITVLLNGLHVLDYNVAYFDPELVKAGFSVGLVLAIATTFFAPSSILEQVAREKARLETELAYQAKLIHTARLAALGEMAGGIAHEINNPLAILQVLSNVLRLSVEKEPFDRNLFKEKTAVLDKTVHRIAAIIASLRAFSRDASEDPFETVPMAKVVGDTLGLCREKLREAGIELKVSEIDPSLSVRGRPVELSQLLLNLLNNAQEAAAAAKEKWIRVSAARENGRVAISVSDSGSGVKPEIAEKIFEPFFTTKAFGKGPGLGLSVSQGIAEAHGGTLTHDPVERSRFVLSLPLARA